MLLLVAGDCLKGCERTHVISATAQGIKELIGALQARGIAVYLISGGFRELTLPVARELGVPCENVFADRMNWQARCTGCA